MNHSVESTIDSIASRFPMIFARIFAPVVSKRSNGVNGSCRPSGEKESNVKSCFFHGLLFASSPTYFRTVLDFVEATGTVAKNVNIMLLMVLLMEEILHQFIWRISQFSLGF